jgi:RNA-directed DNA polymerase
MPTLLSEAEGNTERGGNRKSCDDPARSKTPCTPGSVLHRSWEISSVPALYGRAGRGR